MYLRIPINKRFLIIILSLFKLRGYAGGWKQYQCTVLTCEDADRPVRTVTSSKPGSHCSYTSYKRRCMQTWWQTWCQNYLVSSLYVCPIGRTKTVRGHVRSMLTYEAKVIEACLHIILASCLQRRRVPRCISVSVWRPSFSWTWWTSPMAHSVRGLSSKMGGIGGRVV